MPKNVNSVLVAALCGATALAALPAEVLAGPMCATHPTSVGLTTSIGKVHYRGYRRGYYIHGGYYRRGYGVPGAAVGAAAGVAGAAAGLLGAGIAGASGYGYPGYGYGYGSGYGGNSCWVWDPGAGWVWGCR